MVDLKCYIFEVDKNVTILKIKLFNKKDGIIVIWFI